MDVPLDLASYTRVLKKARTPTWEEFRKVALVAGAGICFVGLLGFIIFVVMSFLPT